MNGFSFTGEGDVTERGTLDGTGILLTGGDWTRCDMEVSMMWDAGWTDGAYNQDRR